MRNKKGQFQKGDNQCLKHGHAIKGHESPEYGIWIGIKQRCYNSNISRYDRYGGRGIKVCERWLASYEAFYQDMGRRPSIKHSIERLDNDLDYTPENCAWKTKKEQANNRSSNIVIELWGEKKNISEWYSITGIQRATLQKRYHAGWKSKDILITPVGTTNKRYKYFEIKHSFGIVNA